MNRPMRHPALRYGVLVLAVGMPLASVTAQEASTDTEAVRLDDVVVTAQKRKQSLEDVPISISVLDRETLEKSRARNLNDLQQLVPNFAFERSGNASLAIRGVGGGGRNVGFDTRAGLYLDGVYLGQSQALNMPLFDIAQVEVLRGPQGHLFGRNTVSGAVNITTEAPSPVFGSSLRAVAGNENAYDVYGSVTGPLAYGVAGKLSVGYETRDGFVHNRFDDSTLDDLERFSTRGQLHFDVSERFTLDVYGDYSDTDENAIVGESVTDLFDTPVPGLPLPRREVSFNSRPFTDATLWGGSVAANYRLDGGQTLTAITGYRSTEQWRQSDSDYGPHDIMRINFHDDIDQFSQELRLASSDEGALRYVAGVYYLNEQADSDRRATAGQELDTIIPLPAGSPFPFAPAGLAFGIVPGAVIPAIARIETEDVAAFASVDVDVAPRLTLNLGARFTHETKDLVFNLDGSQSGAFLIATLQDFRDRRTDNEFNPTAGLTFALSDDVNLYAKYANGFKSGGWNVDFLNLGQVATGFDFDTETVDSYEIGIKGVALDNRIRFDLAAFYNQFDDFQIFQFVALGGGTTILQLRNAAKVETQGFDGSISFQASEALRLGASIGYVDATFDRFPEGGPGGADLSGNELPAPDFTAALTVDYGVALPTLNGRLDLYGEYSYRGAYFAGATNDPSFERIGSRNLVHTRLGYSHDSGRYGVSLWARNLFDENYLQDRSRDFLSNQYLRRGEPRTYGIEVWHQF